MNQQSSPIEQAAEEYLDKMGKLPFLTWKRLNEKDHFIAGSQWQAGASSMQSTEPQPDRFKKPTDEQIVKAALLFGDGNLDDKGRLTDMVGLCLWVVDRLYENGDILIPSSKEEK